MQQLVDAAARREGEEDESPPELKLDLTFYGVVFRDEITIEVEDVTIDIHVAGATFEKSARFHATLGRTSFLYVSFVDLSFTGSTFTDRTRFEQLDSYGALSFDDAHFQGETRFDAIRVYSGVFTRARFAAPVDLVARFRGIVNLNDAVFEDSASLTLSDAEETYFPDATFAAPTFMWIASGLLSLDQAKFSDSVILRTGSERTSLYRTQFVGQFTINCYGGELDARATEFAGRGTIIGERRDEYAPARISELVEATISNLTLARVDLSRCRFWDANGLDDLRIESSCTFAAPPRGWRYTKRRTILEENVWRGGRWLAAAGLTPDDDIARMRPGTGAVSSFPSSPDEIAPLYRSLRKATENRKNEPGAADFYYGEMEMRRHAATWLSGERILLTLYWAVSGYALRPSRALIALAAICLLFAAAFRAFGYVEPHSYGDMLIYSVGSSARVKTGFENDALTNTGEVLHILLGVVGPILYGLSLLSVRGRVKR